MKNSIVLATAVASVLASGVAAAGVTANAGVFSNYIWRGVTQTNDQAAGQGGIDWSSDSGLYAGTWLSNVSSFGNGYEMDLYAGFSGEASGIGYDLGVISYQYPADPTNSNFTEVYVSGSMAGASVGIWYTVDKASGLEDPAGNDDDIYTYASYGFDNGGIDYSVYVGNYNFDAAGATDYTHYGASLGKDGFGFAVDKNDMDGAAGNVRFTVSYSKDFEL